jgi:hypothetical protein
MLLESSVNDVIHETMLLGSAYHSDLYIIIDLLGLHRSHSIGLVAALGTRVNGRWGRLGGRLDFSRMYLNSSGLYRVSISGNGENSEMINLPRTLSRLHSPSCA